MSIGSNPAWTRVTNAPLGWATYNGQPHLCLVYPHTQAVPINPLNGFKLQDPAFWHEEQYP